MYSRNIFCFPLQYDFVPMHLIETNTESMTDADIARHSKWMEENSGGNPYGRSMYYKAENGVKKNAWILVKTVKKPLADYITTICKLNTINEKYDVCIQWMFGSDGRNVHTDWKRSWTLFYVIDTGGSNVITSWYIEEGKPLVREWDPSLSKIEDNSPYKKVFEMTLKPQTWYFFNSSILHSVENATSVRSMLFVNFKDRYMKDMKDLEV